MLRTALCDLLCIDLPIVQSGMNRVAGPDLVAEVSNAGGLGILAGLNIPPEELRTAIRRIRSLTSRPFGVNFWMHPAVVSPPDPATIADVTLLAAQAQLNVFRGRLGLSPRTERPPPPPKLLDAGFRVVIEERVPVLSTGLGDPGVERVRACHEAGIKVMTMVANVPEARQVAANGVDIVVAQGSEAGGHRSTWTEGEPVGTVALVPQIVDAVQVPVLASGGIADGRGVAAALALGAAGVLLGTRFVATKESQAPEYWKRALLEKGSETSTVTRVITGLPARAIKNAYIREYEESGAPVLPPLLHRAAALDVHQAAQQKGDAELAPLFAGQSNGLLRDLPGAAQVVRRIAAEAEMVIEELCSARAARPSR